MSQAHRLSYLLMLNLAMITGLIIVGVTAHSIGVLAAGGDYAADSLAILLGLLAVYMRDKHDSHRATTYVALINGLLLLGVTVVVSYQAVRRLLTRSPDVHGLPVLIVATISTSAMVVGVLILGRESGKEDLHMHSVLLDTISDGLSAAVVAIVGGIIFLTRGFFWLDAVAAICISFIIGFGAIKLLIEVAKSLRHSTQIDLHNR